jgi:hypothetical protein
MELKSTKQILITQLSAFGSNVLLTLKIINFEDVSLTNAIHFFVNENKKGEMIQ